MTRDEFARISGVAPHRVCFNLGEETELCLPGAAEASVVVEGTGDSIAYRVPTQDQRFAAYRVVFGEFYGRRLFNLVVRTRYPHPIPHSPLVFDSLKQRFSAMLGPPTRSFKEEGVAPQIEWRVGGRQFWIQTLGTGNANAPVEQVYLGYRDCRLAPSGYEDCH